MHQYRLSMTIHGENERGDYSEEFKKALEELENEDFSNYVVYTQDDYIPLGTGSTILKPIRIYMIKANTETLTDQKGAEKLIENITVATEDMGVPAFRSEKEAKGAETYFVIRAISMF